jgi:hypothetical protein
MVQQHCIAWLWELPWRNLRTAVHDHPVLLGINALGGIAAPLFIMLAGVSTILLETRHSPGAARLRVARGSIILGLGYLLNTLAPCWFSPASWYVLHCIGAAYILSALMCLLSTPVLLVSAAFPFVIAVVLQSFFETPAALGNSAMSSYETLVDVIRLALAEGHFPLFPWLGFFITGMVCGRWIAGKRYGAVGLLAVAVLLCAGTIIGLSFIDLSGVHSPVLHTATTLTSRIYPLFPPLGLLLCGIVLVLLYVFLHIGRVNTGRAAYWCADTGRVSLTVLIAHIVICKQGLFLFDSYKQLSAPLASLATAGIIITILLLAHVWRRYDFRYGFEWMIRTITG